ncbi:MAG TPA: cytochrome d ubiquinol oxidase subunit II [Oceanospirillales bacterium]|nr:cytochrome d ubiquinol oxidase subunit II [Oceanospirillales bacterium]
MMDYESLKLIWWVLIGVLLIGWAITDGFDMGVLTLLKIVGKTDYERRVMLNTVGPHWDGNQVWFITAGGAIFAAWPVVYATAFSGLYFAMLLVLFAMFFRPVGFEYRSKIEETKWRSNWDWLLTVGGAVPSLVFGVAFGNLFLGLPFTLDNTMRSFYEGNFFQLLSPFALLVGVVSLAMLVMHGAAYLQMRTQDEVLERSRKATIVTAVVTLVTFIFAGICLLYWVDGYVITDMTKDAGEAMTPMAKTVTTVEGAWLNNYSIYPITIVAPILAIAGLLLTILFSLKDKSALVFIASSVAISGIICTAGFSLFPFVMPSSIDPSLSLTVWDVVSSKMTLNIMFIVAMIFVPIILAYTIWGYYKMWGRISTQNIEDNKYGTY